MYITIVIITRLSLLGPSWVPLGVSLGSSWGPSWAALRVIVWSSSCDPLPPTRSIPRSRFPRHVAPNPPTPPSSSIK